MAHAKLLLLFYFSLMISLGSSKLTFEVLKENDSKPHGTSILKCLISAFGVVRGVTDQLLLIPKGEVAKKSRKLLEVNLVELDYDYAGPNPKHDPKRGRGGGGHP